MPEEQILKFILKSLKAVLSNIQIATSAPWVCYFLGGKLLNELLLEIWKAMNFKDFDTSLVL